MGLGPGLVRHTQTWRAGDYTASKTVTKRTDVILQGRECLYQRVRHDEMFHYFNMNFSSIVDETSPGRHMTFGAEATQPSVN